MIDLTSSRAQRPRFARRCAHLILVALAAACVVSFAAGANASPQSSSDADPSARARTDATVSSVTTTHTITGVAGYHDWYLSPVTITLQVEGLTSPEATFYRLDGSNWLTYTAPFGVQSDGAHSLDYYSVGDDSSVEPTRSIQVRIDATAPSSSVYMLPGYHDAPGFVVQWGGSDGNASGISGYDVQYKDGLSGAWNDWLVHTATLSATFPGQRGRTYYFRSRAHDIAGNAEPYLGDRGDTFTFIDSVANGGFETGTFSGWSVTGEMSKSITMAAPVGGFGAWSALLGSPDYGDAITPTAQAHVPTDTFASIAQTIRVPALHDLPAPALSVWYRILTYDVVWGCLYPDRLYDSFDLTLRDTSGSILYGPLRDGNFDCQTYNPYSPSRADIVVERLIDLTPYAGRSIVIEMRNSNRQDWSLNTWSYVDRVRVINQPTLLVYRVYLPVIGLNNTMQAPASPAAAPAPTWAPGSRR